MRGPRTRTACRSDPEAANRSPATAGPWEGFRRREAPRIEAGLRQVLRATRSAPASLAEAMRYALFPGGKRLRPALVVLGHRATGGSDPQVYRCAACVELVHTFTLIHDDLPCMDDDDFRRGRPSVHRAFDEAIAVLAGDALLNLAYEALADLRCGPSTLQAVLATLARAVGARGVLGGQVDDIASEGASIEEDFLRSIHLRKTASLIAASLRLGGDLARAKPEALLRLERFGRDLGLLFQITDDLLNVEGTLAELGRPAGGDERRRAATYPRIAGTVATRARLRRLLRSSLRAAGGFGVASPIFEDLVRAVAARVEAGRLAGGGGP